jgi:hypothetical protein
VCRALILFCRVLEIRSMMGEHGFSLERRVPDNHLLREIDRFVDLSEARGHLNPIMATSSDRRLIFADDAVLQNRVSVAEFPGIREKNRESS